jgi:hypothetical protein
MHRIPDPDPQHCTEPKFVNLLRSPGIDSDSLESIPGLLKHLQIRAQSVLLYLNQAFDAARYCQHFLHVYNQVVDPYPFWPA